MRFVKGAGGDVSYDPATIVFRRSSRTTAIGGSSWIRFPKVVSQSKDTTGVVELTNYRSDER